MKISNLLKILSLLMGICFFIISTQQLYAYCGDGILEKPQEECDDGNYIERDKCSSYCKVEDMEAPTVKSISTADNATSVNTLIKKITVTFSEEVQSSDINKDNISLEYSTNIVDINVSLNDDKKTITITVNTKLVAETIHAIKIRNIRDIAGNAIKGEQAGGYYISTFTTAEAVDTTPPTIVVYPTGGTYSFTQEVKLTPYIDTYTKSDDFIDKTAKIYYTLNDVNLSTTSSVYSSPISISEGATLRYFAVDSLGNQSSVFTERYRLKCPEYTNAKKVVDSYPTCKILECNYGYAIKNESCVQHLGNEPTDYKTNAITAPLLESSTPMTISTRPAIYVSMEHRGLIKRPIIFKDTSRDIIIEFEQNTEITDKDGKPFKGYIKHPDNLSIKNYPINYGYVFRSILEFKSGEGEDLNFSPAYKITIPYTNSFNYSEDAVVFQYDEKNENYTEYDKNSYKIDGVAESVIITAKKTGIFFIAQKGQDYNKAVFNDTTTHWAKNYIEELFRKGIVKGRSQGIYAPNEKLTRAEFVKIALKAIGENIDITAEINDPPFTDIPLYSWYAPYVKRAKDLNLINGYSGNKFKPDMVINRAEAIKILFSAFKFDLSTTNQASTGNVSLQEYIDLRKTDWFFDYANFAIQNEIMSGIQGSSSSVRLFNPSKPITRAEIAKITIKAIELNDELKKKK